MKKLCLLLILYLSITGCQKFGGSTIAVSNANELTEALSNAGPGDVIVMANGEWSDLQIRFIARGSEKRPIILRAETPGQVIIQGASDLKLGGEYLVVDGLYFTNGYSPSNAVIEFAINRDTVANHSRVTNCVIKDFNKLQRSQTDLWIQFKGRHNQLDRCYISGKSNRGPTVRVDLAGNENINNYHKIINNHFGPRPPKGGPSAETLQLGNSSTSMCPSYTLVANNLFERCDGEVEIISSKSNFNEFRNNVFYKSEGSLVTRHGNYCIVDGNYFIGDDQSDHIGGVRLIGTGHWVTNNYFYNLRGKEFRSPLAVMNGIPRSPLNRYIQVTDVVIAHNSWVNCTSPWQFGVGSNLDQKDVLPASEIRSDRPIRTTVANNLIYHEVGDAQPVVAHDKLDGINFKSNVINNRGVEFEKLDGLETRSFSQKKLTENIWVPDSEVDDLELYAGFEFDKNIPTDLLGASRASQNSIGAVAGSPDADPGILDMAKYGPAWYIHSPKTQGEIHSVNPGSSLSGIIQTASDGDTIELVGGNYELPASLKIDRTLTIRSSQGDHKANILYTGEAGTPAFEMNPNGQLTLKNIILRGNKDQYAFAPLKNNMSSLYNLTVEDCEISDFDFVLKAYKHSFARFIKFISTTMKSCNNGLELSEETEDRGEYNAENIIISDCLFEGIDKNVIDYYRGGYDESTVGGNLSVINNTFTNCGSKEENGVLLNTYGIINVDISGNSFVNNHVRLVAQLWGAKNNTHSGNQLLNSGKIAVEENLKLNLMY
ncbi:MAG: hypothetical protein DHS20C17_22270 [Cyclobacteriaceae bacterium]|nr:MAG: hypothetical protein DHS20C17_22270 [Cyclobacteriaceae bacterium]